MSMLETNRLGELTEQLKDVVRGYHPITKERFAETSDLKDPAIIDLHVLLLAELITMPVNTHNIDFKTIMTRSNNERFGKPNNHGARWTQDDLHKLADLFLKDADIIELSDQFGRTVGSVLGKLLEMEVITKVERDQLFKSYILHFRSVLRDQID